jgi:hypothetical protein
MRTTPSKLACPLFATLAIAGCAQIPLHANLTDREYRARLDEHFHAGMTRAEVETTLDELDVSKKTRLWYDEPGQAAPPQLLVRVYETGGFWLDEEDQSVQWVDTVYVFGRQSPEPLLDRVETFRRRQRYFHGEPVNIPDEPTLHPWGDYPMPPPPPARPLVDS